MGAALLLGVIVGAGFALSGAGAQEGPRTVTPRGPLDAIERHTITVFENASPSVASIFTARVTGGVFQPETLQPAGTGSGFIWDDRGHVVTNNHMVEGADAVAVKLGAGDAVPARIVGRAPDYDLAVLKLERAPDGARPLPIGRSAELKVGQIVYAIGNPFGLDRTLTTGIISALDHRLPTARGREIPGVIQTDAAINPGNSGGPLLDSAGRLIGVNTAIISGSGASAGVGFAVPVDLVNRIVPPLIAKGRVPTPGIGILAAPESIAGQLNIAGVIVAEVAAGSPAARAGLEGMDPRAGRLGDVITQVNGKPVGTVHELAQALFELGVGAKARLTVMRDGKSREVTVTIGDIS